VTVGDESGSVNLELAVLTPAFLALLLLVVAAGRIALAHGQVEGAARDAARAASMQRNDPAAQLVATNIAQTSLAGEHLTCRGLAVEVTGGFGVPVGTPATVTATVRCTAALDDLALPGLPGSRTVSASSVASLDTYRGR
jgi:Flp pilus assembly protein TadG